MRLTSVGALPGPMIVGEGRIGYDYVAPGGLSREWLNQRLVEEPDAAVLLVSGVEKRVALEPDRRLYTLDNEAEAATGSLERITGAVDGQIVIVRASHVDRVLTLVDGGEVVEDELAGQFIVPGGDITLRDGDMVVLEYNATIGRWIGHTVFRAAAVSVADTEGSATALAEHVHSHEHYVLVDGTRPLIGDWDNTGRRIRNTGVAEVASSAPPTVIGRVWLDTAATGTGGTGLLSRVTTTVDLTLTPSHNFVLADASLRPLTITLPPASANGGRDYTIKKPDASPNTVTIAADGDDTIDRAPTAVLTDQDEAIAVNGDSVEGNWNIH